MIRGFLFFLLKKITSMLAYREWYVARTNQIVQRMYLAPIRSPRQGIYFVPNSVVFVALFGMLSHAQHAYICLSNDNEFLRFVSQSSNFWCGSRPHAASLPQVMSTYMITQFFNIVNDEFRLSFFQLCAVVRLPS